MAGKESGRTSMNGTSNNESETESTSEVPEVVIDRQHVRMKKSINLLHSVAILVAVTGHISIFISPAIIFRSSGSIGVYLLVWLVGGIINIGVSLCYVELATIFPRAGGPYSYALNVFGPLPGFMILWGYVVLVQGPFWAFLSYAAALYILQPFYPHCKPDEKGVKVLAGWILITFVAVNCIYMKYVTKIQTFLSSTKLMGLALIVICGIVTLAQGYEVKENFDEVFDNTPNDVGHLSMAVFYSIFVYGGWQIICGLMEEVKDPGRDIPRAVCITFGIVTATYVLVNAAYFIVLTPAEFLSSDAVAVTFTHKFFPAFTPLMSSLVGLCTIGVLNASIMGHSRLLFAGARNGHGPAVLGMLHIKYLTPWPAIFAVSCISFIMLFSGGLTTFMQFIQVFSTFMAIMTISALIYLRWKQPDLHRPYRTNIINAVFQLFLQVVILLMALIGEPVKIGTGFLIIFMAVPVYWLGISWKSKPQSFTMFMARVTVYAQKAMMLGKSA